MKSTWIIALGSIKKKKTETLLIGTSIVVSVLAICASLGLLAGLDRPYETMVRETNAAHLLLFFDTRVHDPEAFASWLKARPEVTAVTPKMPIYMTNREIMVGDERIESDLLLTEYSSATALDRLLIVAALDDAKEAPDRGEIWVPKRLAGTQGIELGDMLRIAAPNGMQDFLVSALVVDPHFSTNAVSPTRCWVAPGYLAFCFPIGELNQAYLGARLADPDQADSIHKAFIDSLGGNFAGFALHYGLFKMAHGILLRMLAVTLLVVALLAMIVSVFIVSASITSAIRADYTLIGIYKTLGMTPRQVKGLYVFQYLLLAALFVPLGVLAGTLTTRAAFGMIINAVGLANLSFPVALPALVSAALVAAVIWLSAWWTSRTAGRIEPMEAIRFGAPPQIVRRRLSAVATLGSLPLPLFLGLRNLFLNTRRTIFSTIGLVFTIFVLVFSINIVSSFERFGENLALLGEVDCDVTVRLTGRRFTIRPEQFRELMGREAEVSAMTPYGSLQGMVPGRDGRPSRQISGRVFDGEMDTGGLLNLEGRNPDKINEISIGVNTAKIDRKTIGDTFDIFLEGQLMAFKVTGIYQTAVNFGDGFRLRAEPVKELVPNWRPRAFALHLRDGASPEAFKAGLKQRFAESITVRTIFEDSEQLDRQVAGMKLALFFVSLILLGASFIAIFNDTVLSIKEQTRSLGILKTTGLTPSQLRLSLACKALAVSALALLFGLPLSLFGIPAMLDAMVSGIGMVDFPFAIDVTGTLLIIPGLMLFAFACAWLPARAVTRLRVRDLIHS